MVGPSSCVAWVAVLPWVSPALRGVSSTTVLSAPIALASCRGLPQISQVVLPGVFSKVHIPHAQPVGAGGGSNTAGGGTG
eukprot:CAMPEP_0185756840 /NCGR_PEP_ID=MMETSP1174-20130828/15237_1 /TAXON_ID=35687 /ORGANISM="Dictyocha speculum, Strain CCMP1381" /LENGTH=79 /DNA_ID=CAMNT_0028435975 /DNA_START=740 /DNA_END=979 /DNA_ORIENTATION=-